MPNDETPRGPTGARPYLRLVHGPGPTGPFGGTGPTGMPGPTGLSSSTATAFVFVPEPMPFIGAEESDDLVEEQEPRACDKCGRAVDESGVFRKNFGEGFDPLDE